MTERDIAFQRLLLSAMEAKYRLQNKINNSSTDDIAAEKNVKYFQCIFIK